MTSKEALEIIVRKHCISNTDEEDEELEKCYKQVKADLNVLEILKRHLKAYNLWQKKVYDLWQKIGTDYCGISEFATYCGTSEFATHTAISLYWDNEELSVDSKEGKEHKLVKDSLTNDK